MTTLSKLSCEACNKNAKPLNQGEIDTLLSEIPDWEIITDSSIQKLKYKFQTRNYSKSLTFTNAVAKLAESENHHPQIILEYSAVTIIWWSHNISALHINDFIMAAKTSALFQNQLT